MVTKSNLLIEGSSGHTHTHTHTHTRTQTHAHTNTCTHKHTQKCVEADPCFDGVQCVERDDGYECGGCPPGFRGNSKRGFNLTDAQTKQVSVTVTCDVITA